MASGLGEGRAFRIDIKDAVVRFGSLVVVDNLSISVAPGEILSLVGPSGCGKTTTLRVVAGLQSLNGGAILFDGQPVRGLPPHRRNVGMVFQNYALFPHMTVRENILFGLQMHRLSQSEAGRRAEKVMELLQIGHLARSFPDQLSGGQQQRTALARTLVVEPAVLLLDEPLSALDRQLRDAMRFELRQLLKAVNITTIIVTHDQDEAFVLSDRLAVMWNGRIEQVGRPADVYLRPSTRFVASFLGEINYIGGRVSGSGDGSVLVTLDSGCVVAVRDGRRREAGAAVAIAVRPEAIRMRSGEAGAALGENRVPAILEGIGFQGGVSHYHFRLEGGARVTVTQTPNAASVSAGGPALNSEVMLCWATDSGAILDGTPLPAATAVHA
jgi:ABC-type Fe3+/spermidine/putrescine transport system ATPase subunit